ncbi:hypothetical protein AA0116_g9317 [Alternaria tenuissima]|nr:hypothetical protein AA0116_g9317 [Alternaria tenuissima]
MAEPAGLSLSAIFRANTVGTLGSEVNGVGLFSLQDSIPKSKFKATIVAVHGLGGHYTRTWTDTTVDPPFFWIKDGLGRDLPECRLLSFGWNASIAAAEGTLKGHATNFHGLLLELLGTEGKDQPIVFIAHGIGGIIVKESQVLIQSFQSSNATVHRRTFAILFLGTPHRSSRMTTKYLSALASVGPDSEQQKVKPLVRELSKNSVSLQSTNEAFMHIPPMYQIYSFYETLAPRQGNGLLVTSEEATLNMVQERIIPLPASHADMASFRQKGGGNNSYQTVLQILQQIISRLPKIRPPAISKPPGAPIPPDSGHKLATPKRIDFKGYVHLFKQAVLSRTKECYISDMLVKSPTTLLNDINDASDEDGNASNEDVLEPLIWVHVPLNYTAWVNLPYLHWDTIDCFIQRAQFTKDTLGGRHADIPDRLSEEGKAIYKIIRNDSSNASSLHPRRSLDQFFYSSLHNTTSRDQDQVLSKYTPEDVRGGKKMIMVDQLWLWLLESHGSGSNTPGEIRTPVKTSIFTSFSRKQREAGEFENDIEDIADLRQAIIDEANGMDVEQATDRCLYVGLIIEQAVNVMLRVKTEESLDILEVFRAAIGEAAEKQTNFFRDFQKKMQPDSGDPRALNDPNGTQTKRREVELVLELTDIIDELNTIDRLFDAQWDALDAAVKIVHNLGPRYVSLKHKLDSIKTQDILEYRKQVGRMTVDAKRTEDNLMDLLDLQQKEETLKEVHYSNVQANAARKQADETEAQSQILFLFTIVTIVFAPLSFFTSYYGMNVREFSGDAANTNQQAVWKAMGPFSGVIILGLLGGAWYIIQQAKKKQHKRDKDDNAEEAKDRGASEARSHS